MRLPLLSGWFLQTDASPEAPERDGSAFTLPGADALDGFSDLLGEASQSPQDSSGFACVYGGAADRVPDGIPFPLPGALAAQDGTDTTAIARQVSFGALHGDRATLTFGLLAGHGEVWLGDKRLAAFDGGPLALDVTDALRLARTQTLQLRFHAALVAQGESSAGAANDAIAPDIARPAGVFGPVTLRVSRCAHLAQTRILPDANARTMTVQARIHASRAGEYLLRASFCTAGESSPVREISASIPENGEHALELTMDAPAPRFAPGTPYDAPSLRVQLWLRAQACDAYPGALCDEELLLCGYPGPAPRFWLPLSREDCLLSPDALVSRLRALHIACVGAPDTVSETTLLALTRAGISAHIHTNDAEKKALLSRFPCAVFADDADASSCFGISQNRMRLLAARDLCSMTAYPRPVDSETSPSAILADATGRGIDPDDPGARGVLAWLRAVTLRLRAEALRQGVTTGALCLPGEWAQEDVFAALSAALAPLHLSALPLYGAWWTCSRFSVALRAFAPEDETGLTAAASLETEDGETLASVRKPCPPGGGRLGHIEATLPERPCVLTLHTRLLRGEDVVEESVFPVYVGERGPLESAF